jgi:heme exporter protein A
MLECENLSCARNNKILFKNLGFKVGPKSKILITGPNGSGKTSLIRSLSRLLPPVSGNIRHCGKDIYDDPKSYIPSMVYAFYLYIKNISYVLKVVAECSVGVFRSIR